MTTPTPGTSLVPFSNDSYSIRALEIDGEPWFVAKDVCDALDIGDHAQSLRHLDGDEKGLSTEQTPGGAQQVSIISEAGLYSLILRSRKPEAKPFKRWVTHDVLPAIRKHGVYSVAAPAPVPLREDKSEALKLLQYKTRAERKEARELEAKGMYRNPLTGEILPLPGGAVVRYEFTPGAELEGKILQVVETAEFRALRAARKEDDSPYR
jgi:prophage antirepressor-like protein